MRKGEPGRLRDLESKALSVGSDPDGGYLVPDETNIPEEVVRDIYAARYWKLGRCDDLPPALAFFHFDASVNHGVTGAARPIQEAVGTDDDGEIGPLTLAASKRLPVRRALENYAEIRRRRYRALPHFWRFGRGWLARVDKTLARARQISAQSDQTPDNSSATQKGPSNMPTSSQPKWWGESMTIWGAIVTGLTTVLPALGPAIGVDITADLVREVGEQIVQTVQGFGGLVGIAMTIFGRIRASAPLERRAVSMKL